MLYIGGQIMNTFEATAELMKILDSRRTSLYEQNKEKFKVISRIFDYCLNSMSNEYRNVLDKTFINPSYKFWWVDYYSQSSFYRMRQKAVSSFVSLYMMIYENLNDFTNIIA